MHEAITSGRHLRSRFLTDQSGLSTVEYVIILVLIAAVAIGGWATFGNDVRCALGLTTDELNTAFDSGQSATSAQACAKGQGDSNPGGGSAPEPAPTPSGGDTPPPKKTKRINSPSG